MGILVTFPNDFTHVTIMLETIAIIAAPCFFALMFLDYSKFFFPDNSCLRKVKQCESCLIIVGGVFLIIALLVGIAGALEEQELGFTFFINWSMMFNINFSFQFAICANMVQLICGVNLLTDLIEGAIKTINRVR